MTLDELKSLAGIKQKSPCMDMENISHTGTEKAEIMRKKNIQPVLTNGLSYGFQNRT